MTTRLLTVPQFSQHHIGISQAALRFHIFKADENGLAAAGAICRIGRRVLIDEEKFIGWVRSQSQTIAVT